MKKLMGIVVTVLLVAGLGAWGAQSALADSGSAAPAASASVSDQRVIPQPNRLVFAPAAAPAANPYGRQIPTKCTITLLSGKRLRAGKQAVISLKVKANTKTQPRGPVVVRKKRNKRFVGSAANQHRFYPGHPKTYHFGAITIPNKYSYNMKFTKGAKYKLRDCHAVKRFTVVKAANHS